jgi:predicted acyl esterase
MEPIALIPGEVVEVEMPLDTISWMFPVGHTIRLLLAGADWPNVWPAPKPAGLKLVNGQFGYASLQLPVIDLTGAAEIGRQELNPTSDGTRGTRRL